MKTIVIGLDGASWYLIDPWIEKGLLPNLRILKENGSWGISKCCLPAVTCPNWRCLVTGKNPGKLGVFWFQQLDKKQKKIKGFNSTSFKSKDIFDILSENGFRVGAINMATTFPPKKIRGFMISGAPDSGYQGFTYPRTLENDLRNRFDYRIYPRGHIASKDDIDEYFEDILNLIDLRFKVVEEYLPTMDYIHVSIFYINVLHHFLYDEEKVLMAWKKIDERIGNLIHDDHVIVLASDHGTNEIKTTFYLNTWLEKKGYLTTKKNIYEGLSKFGFTKQNLLRITNKLYLTNFIKSRLPEKLKRSIPSEDGTRAGTLLLTEHVDLENSKAVGVGQGLIYILNTENESEYIKIREEIAEELKLLKYQDLPIAKKVFKKEEVYTGLYIDEAPDIIYEEGDHTYTSTGIGKKVIFEARSERWKGENHRDGIFLIAGNGIKKRHKIQGLNITDIAPTLLYYLGVKSEEDFDGRVIYDIFENRNMTHKKVEINKRSMKINNIRKKINEKLK